MESMMQKTSPLTSSMELDPRYSQVNLLAQDITDGGLAAQLDSSSGYRQYKETIDSSALPIQSSTAWSFMIDLIRSPNQYGGLNDTVRRFRENVVRYATVHMGVDLTNNVPSTVLAQAMRFNPSRKLLEDMTFTLTQPSTQRLWSHVVRATRRIASGYYGTVSRVSLVYIYDDVVFIDRLDEILDGQQDGSITLRQIADMIEKLHRELPTHAALKTANNEEAVAELYHEGLILEQLRPLRMEFTTLPMLYASTTCNGTILNHKNDIIVTCSEAGLTEPYVLMEYIDGTKFGDAVGSMDDITIATTLVVIHGYLRVAWERYGLVHADLHPGNILLKGWGSGERFHVPIPGHPQSMSVILPFIPVVVDYGTSKTFKYSYLEAGTTPDVTPVADICRLYSFLPLSTNSSVVAEVSAYISQYVITDFTVENGGTIMSYPPVYVPYAVRQAITHLKIQSILQKYLGTLLLYEYQNIDGVEGLQPFGPDLVTFAPDSRVIKIADLKQRYNRSAKLVDALRSKDMDLDTLRQYLVLYMEQVSNVL